MMEHAFTVMLRAELTTASQNKLSALTQSALKLRPGVVARVLHNHVKQVRPEQTTENPQESLSRLP